MSRPYYLVRQHDELSYLDESRTYKKDKFARHSWAQFNITIQGGGNRVASSERSDLILLNPDGSLHEVLVFEARDTISDAPELAITAWLEETPGNEAWERYTINYGGAVASSTWYHMWTYQDGDERKGAFDSIQATIKDKFPEAVRMLLLTGVIT